MTIALFFSQTANYAITDQWDYYTAKESSALADRWESAVASTVKLLLTAPERGALCRLPHPAISELRWVPVDGFPFRIFYLHDAESTRLTVVHVLHNRRDIEDLLEIALRKV
jgi:plasmid stabilization system protein ParE